MLTIAAASLLVGVAAILLPNSVVILALGGLVARGLYGLILCGELGQDEDPYTSRSRSSRYWLDPRTVPDEPVDLAAALKASVEAAHQRRIEAMGDAS